MVNNELTTAVRNVFRKRGNVWEIVWHGDRFYVEHTDGMVYLHALIRGMDDAPPGTPIPIMILRKAVLLGKTTVNAQKDLERIEALQNQLESGVENLELLDTERDNANQIMDDRAERDIRKRRKKIENDRRELNAQLSGGNISDSYKTLCEKKLDALNAEDEFILSELGKSKDIWGRKRKFRDQRETIRIAIKQAIDRAIENIRVASPEFGKYLDDHVTTGMQCGCRDDRNLHWDT